MTRHCLHPGPFAPASAQTCCVCEVEIPCDEADATCAPSQVSDSPLSDEKGSEAP